MNLNNKRIARWIGFAVIFLILYSAASLLLYAGSAILFMNGTTLSNPLINAFQRDFYHSSYRKIWQSQTECVDFDAELIYKPKIGACKFKNPEFDTTLSFDERGRTASSVPVSGAGIAVLGDSHAMGWGVADNDTFSAIMQKILKRPVYNLAVSSYATRRELLRLERSGRLAAIDTVVLQYSDNDLEENESAKESDPQATRSKFDRLFGESDSKYQTRLVLAWHYFSRALYHPIKTLLNVFADENIEDFAPHYKALIDTLKGFQWITTKRVLVFYSNRHGLRFKDYPVGFSEHIPNLRFLDLNLLRSDYYLVDDHLTKHGHAKIARELARVLSDTKD